MDYLSSVKWDVVYKKALQEDGSLFFPNRLTHEFLDNARRTMGSILFANQYQNEVLPEGEAPFKKEWIRYFDKRPQNTYRFVFIDPAISLEVGSDYTGLVVVEVDETGNWYLLLARRLKITPTDIMNLVFRINNAYSPRIIGIEDVAYQRALLYMLDEEMRRRNVVIPVKGIKPTPDKSKEQRILGLVPRFEWNRITIAPGMTDFEDEYNSFPRGSHDDIIDALAYVEQIVYYPDRVSTEIKKPLSANDPKYESWYIRNLVKKANGEDYENPGYANEDYGSE